MSLLLDALKRAAQEKLEKQRQDGTGAADSSDFLSLVIAEDENQGIQPAAVFSDTGNGDNLADNDLRLHRSDVLASELQAFMGRTNTEYTVETPDLEPSAPLPEPE